LEAHGERPDIATTATAGGSDSTVEAMGIVDPSPNGGRKNTVVTERAPRREYMAPKS
jgi:hypothetical protein